MSTIIDLQGSLGGSIKDTLEGAVDGYIKQLGGKPKLTELEVNENGIYLPPEGYDGFNKATVEIPDPPSPVYETLNITENGIYIPPQGVDGYNEVIANIPPQLSRPPIYVLRVPYSNNDSSESHTYTIEHFLPNIDLREMTIFTDLYYTYYTGSTSYTTSIYFDNITEHEYRHGWGTQSGRSMQDYRILCAPPNNIHLLSDFNEYTSSGSYEFNLPPDTQTLNVDDFYIDFNRISSGGMGDASSYITKEIINNKLIITIPAVKNLRMRILYVL